MLVGVLNLADLTEGCVRYLILVLIDRESTVFNEYTCKI